MIRVTSLRVFRLSVILLAAWLLQIAERRSVLPDDSIALNDVRTFFPETHRLSGPDERSIRTV